MQKLWQVFPGIYMPERRTDNFKTNVTSADTSHTCSRGHKNEYIAEEYMDWA